MSSLILSGLFDASFQRRFLSLDALFLRRRLNPRGRYWFAGDWLSSSYLFCRNHNYGTHNVGDICYNDAHNHNHSHSHNLTH